MSDPSRLASDRRSPAPGSEPSGYLPFVDGLRAVSILAVVGCHVGLPGFSGGYVGVDVFFVISGYLIINQIRSGLEAGRFSIVSFYARRTLRILPPYIVVLLAVFLVAPFVLPTPDTYFDFVQSAMAAPVMLSNIFFYLKQGYFDISANEKPLLHTWTLAVEEQFYLVIPILLVLAFKLGRNRFGAAALAIAIALAAVSLVGAMAYTTTEGRNPAFYFAHWRMWEFIVGGLMAGSLPAAVASWPRAVWEAVGALGLACIAVAVVVFGATTPYPSWRAALPVAGAALVIVAGISRAPTFASRLLTLPWMVGIGLVSYGWYLWHWPILSFMRIYRLNEPWLLADIAGGGALALALAFASYRIVERPIRRWGRTGGIARFPGRIFAGGIATTTTAAAIGGLSGLAGYLWIASFVASVYGIEGKGSLDNGCRLLTASAIPSTCLDGKLGVLIGDSHAEAMFGSFARSFAEQGIKLIYVGRGGCDPLRFATSQRRRDRQHGCANLLAPFEQLLARNPPVASVVITPSWNSTSQSVELWQELISEFDRSRTRILLIAPVPGFLRSSLDCVVQSDRYTGNRDRCIRPRKDVEADRAAIVTALKAAAARFDNVRTIDPIELFCDRAVCRPFSGNQVFYKDISHVVTLGADRIHDSFESEFLWVAWKRDSVAAADR